MKGSPSHPLPCLMGGAGNLSKGGSLGPKLTSRHLLSELCKNLPRGYSSSSNTTRGLGHGQSVDTFDSLPSIDAGGLQMVTTCIQEAIFASLASRQLLHLLLETELSPLTSTRGVPQWEAATARCSSCLRRAEVMMNGVGNNKISGRMGSESTSESRVQSYEECTGLKEKLAVSEHRKNWHICAQLCTCSCCHLQHMCGLPSTRSTHENFNLQNLKALNKQQVQKLQLAACPNVSACKNRHHF